MRKQLVVCAVFVSLLLVGVAGCGGDDESSGDTTEATTSETTTSETTTTNTVPPEPTETLADARAAVDGGQYAEAITIATALGAAQTTAIRRIIANRIARQAVSAVRKGDRRAAKRFLAQADRYPTTSLTRQARVSYKAAKERAVARRAAAQQKRRDAAAAERERRAAAQQAPPPPEPSEPSAPSTPGGTCSDTSQTDFPVPAGDPRDRDGDGIACES